MRLTLLLLLGAGACTRPDAGQKGADAAAAVVEMQAPVLPLAEVARAIRRAVDSVEASHERLTVRDRETVAHVYGESGYLPVWLTANGGLRGVAEDALALLRQSADEGLRPADYDVAVLDSVSGRIASGGPPVVDDIARFEAVLTLAVSRYLGDLHDGRVDPRRVGFHLQANMDPHQIVFLLSSALSEGSLTVVARDLAPRLPQYGGLRAVLPKYRELAAAPEETIPELAALAPGDSSLGVAAIRRRLIRLGDLAPGEERDSSRYDSVLVAGVRSFQDRHGLEADGVIGRETLAELRVPLSWRVRQIEFALERLRWIPDLGAGPLVLVNIPMFELSAWDSVTPTATPSFRTGVIVGKALDTETPVLLEEMRYLI
ncbi:MAG: peptidoglycan-binding protein, partial [Gemmatimonadota bacterium]|nr:peptidoglycan-binding protein [Gemmatimonadota bacterium]